MASQESQQQPAKGSIKSSENRLPIAAQPGVERITKGVVRLPRGALRAVPPEEDAPPPPPRRVEPRIVIVPVGRNPNVCTTLDNTKTTDVQRSESDAAAPSTPNKSSTRARIVFTPPRYARLNGKRLCERFCGILDKSETPEKKRVKIQEVQVEGTVQKTGSLSAEEQQRFSSIILKALNDVLSVLNDVTNSLISQQRWNELQAILSSRNSDGMNCSSHNSEGCRSPRMLGESDSRQDHRRFLRKVQGFSQAVHMPGDLNVMGSLAWDGVATSCDPAVPGRV